jgi:hypothetical protein
MGIVPGSARSAEPDELPTATAVALVCARFARCEQPAARLALAGQRSSTAQQDQVAARLEQAGAGAGTSDGHGQATALGIAEGRPNPSHHRDSPRSKAARRAVLSRTTTNDNESRCVESGRQLGSGVTIDDDLGFPVAHEPRGQQPLTPNSGQSDRPVALIE